MLDENYLKLFGKYIKLCSPLGGIPFTWDAANLTLTSNKRTRLKYLITSILLTGTLPWYIFAVCRAVSVDDKSTECLGLACTLAMVLGSEFSWLTLMNQQRFGNFFKTIFTFTLHYQSNIYKFQIHIPKTFKPYHTLYKLSVLIV